MDGVTGYAELRHRGDLFLRVLGEQDWCKEMALERGEQLRGRLDVPPACPVTKPETLPQPRECGCSREFGRSGSGRNEFADRDYKFLDALITLAVRIRNFVLRLAPALIQFFVAKALLFVAPFLVLPDGFNMAPEILFTNQIFFPIFAALIDISGVQKFQALDPFINSHEVFSCWLVTSSLQF